MKKIQKFLLLLLITQKILMNVTKCDRKLLESYGIISFSEPAKEKLIFCPNIKATCCPAYEQFKIFQKYQQEIKPHYVNLNILIPRQLKLLKEKITGLLDSKALVSKIEKIKSKPQKIEAEDLYASLEGTDVAGIIDKAIKYQSESSLYTSSLKSTFFCSICDYTTQHFFKFDKKTVQFNDDSCDDLVRNTIMFSSVLNRKLMPMLQNVSEVISKIHNSGKSMQVAHLTQVNSDIKECAQEFKDNDEELSACKKYCGYYRLNSDLPVYEGYPEFFANIVVEINNLTKGGKGGDKPAKKKSKKMRILEETIKFNTNIINDHDYNFNDPKKDIFNKKKKRLQRMLNMIDEYQNHNRILEEDEENEEIWEDDLDPKVIEKRRMRPDPFDETKIDPEFDDRMVVDMFEIQEILNNGAPKDLDRIIRRHYVESFEAEIENIEDDNIFKVATPEKVDLEKLKSIYSYTGIDFANIIKNMDWSLEFHEIVLSLAGKATGGVEIMDPTLIEAINNISNIDVNSFHEDNFMNFEKNKKYEDNLFDKNIKAGQEAQEIAEKAKMETVKEMLDYYDKTKSKEILDKIQETLDNGGVPVETPKVEGENTTAEETTAKETPVEGTPTEGTPTEGTPAKVTPAKEKPAEEKPAEETASSGGSPDTNAEKKVETDKGKKLKKKKKKKMKKKKML